MKNLQNSYSDVLIFEAKCVHSPKQSSPGEGRLEIPFYALKIQLTSRRCRAKNTHRSLRKQNTTNSRNLSLSLSLSLSYTLLTHLSLSWHTSLKSPNCNLPVKKQTILLWHTDTQNMLIRSRYNTCLLPTNCISPNSTTVTAACFVRLLTVAILREYISQGTYMC